MKYSQSFVNTDCKLPAEISNNVIKYLHNNKDKTIELTLGIYRNSKTNEQLGYYWGHILPLISDVTGEQDRAYLHEVFKGRYAPVKVGSLGRAVTGLSEMNTEQASKFINDVMSFATTELGIKF